METIGSTGMWAGFAGFVVIATAVDLLLLRGQGNRPVSMRQALGWSAVWVAVAGVFAGWLWWYLDATAGRETANERTGEFVTGYLIEKSLAVDNIFVFLMLFTYFAVPAALQKRVLVLGIIGAIVLRTIMILAGAWLIATFHWVLYLFGAFLLLTGVKMWLAAGKAPDLEANPALRWMRGHLPLTPGFHGDRFAVWQDGRRWFTPLFVVMMLIGVTDVVFAVDSIPAIFAITTDPFIVLTSNIFAILGLRALYFVLADLADRFHLLSYGLALILVFVGAKMLFIDLYKIPVWWSLATVGAILAASVVASLATPRTPERKPLKQ
jgi:tellurite resistance protein TerC